jgi:NAD(P)-dependent dehydrogenase (short-subunit alcohol dehydrogenase family)
VTEYPEDAFDALLAVHVRRAFLACKYGLPRMNDGGSVIITSSVVGAMGLGGHPKPASCGRLKPGQ